MVNYVLISAQNYIGSVVKQCLDDDGMEEDDDDDGSDGVFGVTTMLNITKRKVSGTEHTYKLHIGYLDSLNILLC